MTLKELRKARDFSQEEVAASLAAGQPAVAKLEMREDMHAGNCAHFGTESVVADIGEPPVSG